MATTREQLEALLTVLRRDIRSAFLAAIQDIVDTVVLQRVIDAIRSGDVEQAFRELGFSQAAMRPLTAAIDRAYERGGVFTVEGFPKRVTRGVFRFDVRNSRAEAYLRDHSSQLVTRITDDARNNVQNVLQAGMVDGRNPRNVALDIIGRIDPATGKRSGGIVGLTPARMGADGRVTGQAHWVASTRTALENLDESYFNRELRDKRFDRTVRKAIENDKPLDAATIDKLVDRYKDNALKYRGEMIARTEAIQSLNASEYESVKQAVEAGLTPASAVKRHWDSAGHDGRTRFSHLALDRKYAEKGVALDEPFISDVTGARMMFPGDASLGAPASEIVACRCRPKTVIDWLAQIR